MSQIYNITSSFICTLWMVFLVKRRDCRPTLSGIDSSSCVMRISDCTSKRISVNIMSKYNVDIIYLLILHYFVIPVWREVASVS